MSSSLHSRRSGVRRSPALAVATLILASACVPNAGSTPAIGPPSSGAVVPAPGPTASDLPSGAGLPTLVPEAVLQRRPTRVRIDQLRIDLPIVEPPPDPSHFPYCDVAEFLPALSRPGRPGATFLYAHARAGMFLPILEASLDRDGRSMLGMQVEVFTSDERQFVYEVTEVRRHVVSLEFAYRITAEQLILQTSEGPRATREKTILVADPRSEAVASADDARPHANPVRCE